MSLRKDCYKGKTFGGDPELKARMMGRAEGHRIMDRFMQGVYWTGGNEQEYDSETQHHGCAIGCLSTGKTQIMSGRGNSQGSGALEISCEFQIPYLLARLAETAFEGRPFDEAVAWVEKFAAAIPVGVTLTDADIQKWDIPVDDGWGAHREPQILEALKSVTPSEEQEQVKEMLDHLTGKTDAEAEFFKQFRKAREGEKKEIVEAVQAVEVE